MNSVGAQWINKIVKHACTQLIHKRFLGILIAVVKEVAIHKNPELDSTVHSLSLEIQILILEDIARNKLLFRVCLFHPGNLDYNVLFLSIKRYIKYQC